MSFAHIVPFLATFHAVAAGTSVKALTKRLNDGTEMPVIGLGTWKSPPGAVESAVRHAICEAGYRHIDAAQIYDNQVEVGRAIRHALENCGVSRKELWITSKIWNVDFRNVSGAANRILDELGLDYVDQLLLHWPTPYEKPPAGCPPDCPAKFSGTDDPMRPRGPEGKIVLADLEDFSLAESWAELSLVREEGKARSIGVSNFSPLEIDNLKKGMNFIVPAVNQVEAHVFWNQMHLREAMRERGITLVAYSPLGNPGVYGDKFNGMSSSLIAEIASEAHMSPSQVMLAFLIALGDVVVPKSITPGRIKSNINFILNLTDDQIARLAREAPQSRLSNPKNRPGETPVFEDTAVSSSIPPRIVIRSSEL